MDYLDFRRLEFERRNQRLKNSSPMVLKKTDLQKDKLHIVYVMTWTGICGGSKIIFEHCNHLARQNHQITIVCRLPKPTWFILDECINFIQVPFEQILGESIPKCDVIVATYWKEIYECMEQKIAPVVYFEQGDSHLFEPDAYDAFTMEHIKKQINLAPYVYTVSSFAAQKLKEVFGVDATVIPNAVDKTIFFPRKKDDETNHDKTVITAIGSENIPFKCIFNIVVAIQILKKTGKNIEFNWISPDKPNRLTTVPVLVNPAQSKIGDCLRRTDIYVCASLYESFCLPVLEAMTCGATVVTTDNGGVRDFVKEQINAITVKKNSIPDIIDAIEKLIDNPDLRKSLAEEAYKTANDFDWKITTEKLIHYYTEIAKMIL